MPFRKGQPLQRLRFSDHQLLGARDLNADEAYEATLRRMHVRGMHGTWGVALGFYLSLSNDRDQVLVGPGLAYDALGRELLLSETLALPAPQPPIGSTNPLAYDLALSQREPAGILARRRQVSACADTVPAEGVSLRWAQAGEQNGLAADLVARELRLGVEVPLGRFAFDPTTNLFCGPIPGFRKNARPMLRPHIATGTVSLGALQFTSYGLSGSQTVMTNNAGFTAAPQYFVFFPPDAAVGTVVNSGWVGPILSVSQAQHDRFVLHATLAIAGSTHDTDMTPLLTLLKSSQVRWVGVEPVTGYQPNPDFTAVYFATGGLIKQIVGMWSLAMKPFGPG